MLTNLFNCVEGWLKTLNQFSFIFVYRQNTLLSVSVALLYHFDDPFNLSEAHELKLLDYLVYHITSLLKLVLHYATQNKWENNMLYNFIFWHICQEQMVIEYVTHEGCSVV